MKVLRAVLSVALAVVVLSSAAVAGAIFLLGIPTEPKLSPEPQEVVWDYGVPGSPTATHVYINPCVIGPGRYVYAHADKDSFVIGYFEDGLPRH